ncbi:hypothetical protein BH10PSE19_BH10PSE19_02940 [soil metagenome]
MNNKTCLTQRELQILQLFNLGHSYKSAGKELGITSNTVKNHSVSMYKKLNCTSKIEAINKVFACNKLKTLFHE